MHIMGYSSGKKVMNVHPKKKSVIIYSSSRHVKPVWISFCRTHKKYVFIKYVDKQYLPPNWLPLYDIFKISSFIFLQKKESEFWTICIFVFFSTPFKRSHLKVSLWGLGHCMSPEQHSVTPHTLQMGALSLWNKLLQSFTWVITHNNFSVTLF